MTGSGALSEALSPWCVPHGQQHECPLSQPYWAGVTTKVLTRLGDYGYEVMHRNQIETLMRIRDAAIEHRRERSHGVTANVQWADAQLDEALDRLT